MQNIVPLTIDPGHGSTDHVSGLPCSVKGAGSVDTCAKSSDVTERPDSPVGQLLITSTVNLSVASCGPQSSSHSLTNMPVRAVALVTGPS